MKPTLCLDFDGVIHSYASGWKGIDVIPDPPVVDRNGVSAIEKLHQYVEHFQVCIHSARSSSPEGIRAMREWLGNWEAAYWLDHPDLPRPHIALVFCIDFPIHKPPALVTIDDRVVVFDGTFPEVESLLNFKPWNKKEQS